jgi:glutathione S-transferase
MKLYMAPGSCTTGIHILLEELDLAFEAWILNIPAGDNLKPDYVAINPKSTIPTFVCDDGTPITDYVAISYWLARSYPRAKLIPEGALAAARVMEILAYVTATVHGQGFARIFTTDAFAVRPEDHAAVQARGREIVERAFAILDAQLSPTGYAVEQFSIADPALFYVAFWADKLHIPLPPRVAAHFELMRSRPVVQRVLKEEGYR